MTYTGCSSWRCNECKHYAPFLTVATMQGICWNKGCFFEEVEKWHILKGGMKNEHNRTKGSG